MKSKMMARKPGLAGCWSQLSGVGRWLVHNTGVELSVIGGPYRNQKQFMAGLTAFLRSENFNEDDTIHILTFNPKGPEFSEFSGWFMESAKQLAGQARQTTRTKVGYTSV
ncbi:MAG: hypothetical protein AAB268_00655 [Elusimicrobiota bacterium]